MAGESDVHNLIAGEIYTLLVTHLRDLKCLPFFGDIKLRVSKAVYYYPDVLVSCEENPYFRNQPILIVEVTSPSTGRVDRSEKLLYYLQISGLEEYVIIDQHQVNVEMHRRQSSGGWLTYHFNDPGDVIELASVKLSIPLPDLYRRVQFEKDATRED